MFRNLCLTAVASVGVFGALPAHAQDRSEPLATLMVEAERLSELAETDAAKAWLAQVEHLPEVEPRTVYRERTREVNRAFDEAEYAALSDDERAGLTPVPVNSGRYDATLYGSPLAYLRAIDLAAAAHGEGFAWRGARVFDLGYGQVGQLRLLAMCGAHALGWADPPYGMDLKGGLFGRVTVVRRPG